MGIRLISSYPEILVNMATFTKTLNPSHYEN